MTIGENLASRGLRISVEERRYRIFLRMVGIRDPKIAAVRMPLIIVPK